MFSYEGEKKKAATTRVNLENETRYESETVTPTDQVEPSLFLQKRLDLIGRCSGNYASMFQLSRQNFEQVKRSVQPAETTSTHGSPPTSHVK